MEKCEKKHCGSCAYLVGEDIYGYGSCPLKFAELVMCSDDACEKHVEKDKVRKAAAILKQFKRAAHDPMMLRTKNRPKEEEIDEAIDIVARYVNVITKKL